MHRTTLYLPDELHHNLRLLAYATRSGISDLLRAAAEGSYQDLFEDAKDVVSRKRERSPGLRALADTLRNQRLRDRRFARNRD